MEIWPSCKCCSMRGPTRRRPATTDPRPSLTRARRVTRPSCSSCRPAARDDSVLLDEHPAVAFEVLRPVEPAVRVVLRLREDPGPGALRLREVGVHAVHVDAEAVDHPGDRGPSFGGGARLAVVLRTLVVRRRSREEDPTAFEIEFRVTDRSIRFRDSIELPEPEGPNQPVDCRGSVLIRDHRNNPGSLGAGFLDHNPPSCQDVLCVLNTVVPMEPAGVGFVLPVYAPCTFSSHRYKLIYYMNSYLSRNATASHAAQADAQGADLGYPAHGRIRPSEV